MKKLAALSLVAGFVAMTTPAAHAATPVSFSVEVNAQPVAFVALDAAADPLVTAAAVSTADGVQASDTTPQAAIITDVNVYTLSGRLHMTYDAPLVPTLAAPLDHDVTFVYHDVAADESATAGDLTAWHNSFYTKCVIPAGFTTVNCDGIAMGYKKTGLLYGDALEAGYATDAELMLFDGPISSAVDFPNGQFVPTVPEIATGAVQVEAFLPAAVDGGTLTALSALRTSTRTSGTAYRVHYRPIFNGRFRLVAFKKDVRVRKINLGYRTTGAYRKMFYCNKLKGTISLVVKGHAAGVTRLARTYSVSC